jgi:hypothetical protein
MAFGVSRPRSNKAKQASPNKGGSKLPHSKGYGLVQENFFDRSRVFLGERMTQCPKR